MVIAHAGGKWFPTGPMLESCLATLLDLEHKQRRSLMLAGLDESSCAATRLSSRMAPAVRRRLEQEMDEVLGDRPVEVGDFEKLSYARAIAGDRKRGA